jgi:hypothetical protein
MADEEASFEIGYGKPPRASRFQKDASGNPKGRPKGSRNLVSVVLRESQKKVAINDSRGRRQVTKLEAALMQLANKSAQGDLRATREFIPLVEKSEESTAAGVGPLAFAELDQKMLESLQRRLSGSQSESTKPTEENPS